MAASVAFVNSGAGGVPVSVPAVGIVSAVTTAGMVQRYVRRQDEDAMLSPEEEWTVVLSGSRKGSNPRIKLAHGRLWGLRIPPMTTLGVGADGQPHIYARPVHHPDCHPLQLYKRQPIANTIVFSLTNGADKCYLRLALQHSHFNFVYQLVDAVGNAEWYVSTEAIQLHREPTTAARKRLAMQRSAPDGADEVPEYMDAAVPPPAAPLTMPQAPQPNMGFGSMPQMSMFQPTPFPFPDMYGMPGNAPFPMFEPSTLNSVFDDLIDPFHSQLYLFADNAQQPFPQQHQMGAPLPGPPAHLPFA